VSDLRATSSWLEAELDRILSAAPPPEVGRTLPVLFLALARDYGVEALRPEIQAELQKIGVAAGISDQQGPEEVKQRLEQWVTLLGPSPGLLTELEGAYRTHYAAVARTHGRDFHRLVQRRIPLLAPKQGEPAPAGSVRSRDLRHQHTGRFSVR
jgi:hypothetical protein